MSAPSTTIAGAILAGGEASRYYGVPKGTLEIEPGLSIVQREVAELSTVGLVEVVIVANDPVPYEGLGVPVISDLRHRHGPLGGMEAALKHFSGRTDATLFVPCDLPGISSRQFLRLIVEFRMTDRQVAVARTPNSFFEPLCAVVHNGLLPTISHALDEGRRGVGELWQMICAHPVEFADPLPFFNVNTPADMQRWRVIKGGAMARKILTDEQMVPMVLEAVRAADLPFEVITEGPVAIQVALAPEGERPQSTLQKLYSGGWIACSTALALADKLGVTPQKIGKLANALDIKIRKCSLGCF